MKAVSRAGPHLASKSMGYQVGKFADILAVGDARSDGHANEVVRLVSGSPALLPELLQELESPNQIVRAHAADALEKVARTQPKAVATHLSAIVKAARADEVPMVRWHLAMVLEHVCGSAQMAASVVPTLRVLLKDPSPFVRSWAISGLTLLARRTLASTPPLIREISALTADPSAAVAKRAATAIRALTDPTFPIPASWEKGQGGSSGPTPG